MALIKLFLVGFLALESASAKSLSGSDGCLESMWRCVPGPDSFPNHVIDPNSQLSAAQQYLAQSCAFTLNTMLPCYEEFANHCLTNGTDHYYFRGSIELSREQCTNPITPSNAEITLRCGQQMISEPLAASAISTCAQEVFSAMAGNELFTSFSLFGPPTAGGGSSNVNWETLSQTIDSPAMKSFICCDSLRGSYCGLDHVLRICGQEAYDIQLQTIAKQQRAYQCTEAEMTSCRQS